MKGVLATLLIVVGLLITGLSGVCTAVFGVQAIVSALQTPNTNTWPLVVLCLVVGAPFIGGGVALIWGGLALVRRPKPPRTDVF